MNPDWLLPQWPVAPHVRALCTTRVGGASVAPYDQLNLGEHVGDRAQDVAVNRGILQRAIQARPVFLSQVHGLEVVPVTASTPDGTQADACVTDQPGLACTIMVADCLPVLLTNVQGSRVAAAHAGWRGLAGQGGHGVLEEVVAGLCAGPNAASAQPASEVVAWLGPCIGPQAFEVGADVRDAFCKHDGAAGALFRSQPGGKWLADLQALARLRLLAMGVQKIHGNDASPSWCTVSNPSRYFSHRRDRVSGRMAACIWLR
jgi:hypothetical protein